MPRPSTTALLATGLVIMWSSGFIGAELGTRHAPATTLLAWRFITVAALLAAWTTWRRPRIHRRDLALHTLIGALAQTGYLYGVVAAAQTGVPAGTSALIAALQPVVATALAAPLLHHKTGRHQIIGLATGLIGVALVVGSDLGAHHTTPPWAYTLPAAAMLSLVAATLIERRTRPTTDLRDALTVQCGISAVLFTGLAQATGTLTPPADPAFWSAVAWVVLLSTLGGYGLYWAVLARTDITRVSALLYLTPPATMVWAWAMFGDTPTPLSLTGIAVCAAAVLLVHRRPRRKERENGAPAPTPADEDSGNADQSRTR